MYLPTKKLIVLQQTESTNKYATGLIESGAAEHGTAIFAIDQNSGRGRRGRHWISEPGKNVVLSVIIKADELLASRLFHISTATALAVYTLIRENVKANVKIKWPNDIYIDDSKAAGILIENKFKGTKWQWSVAGVGVNVNQTTFGVMVNSPTSLKAVSGNNFDVLPMAERLRELVLERVAEIKAGRAAQLLREYNEVLYAKNKVVKLKYQDRIFQTTILSVSDDGHLLARDVIDREFAFDEVEFRGIVNSVDERH